MTAAFKDASQPFKIEQTESEFQVAVQELASMRGWQWMHIQKALNDRGYWRTPITGVLGKGWPDLVLVRGERLIFAELKANGKKATPLQAQVLGVLTAVHCAEVHVWHPNDWQQITEILR